MPSTDKISQEVINNGFSKVQNWLSQEDQDKITKIILKKKTHKRFVRKYSMFEF